MEQLYLLRHGETELNKKKVYYGATDCALTAKGEREADALAPVFASFGVELCFVSPLIRAVETAKRVFPDGKTTFFRQEENLRELNFGAWEGKHYSDLQSDPVWQSWSADYFHVAPPGGESFAALSQRVAAFRETLLAQREKQIAVVAHHGILTVLMALLLEMPPEKCWHFTFRAGRYSRIRFADGFPILEAHNVALPEER